MERLIAKVLNIVDGDTIEVEIAPLNPRLEKASIERVHLVHREAPESGTFESDLAEIDLHRKLFWKIVILRVLSRDDQRRLVCTVERAVG
jgi:endonuclease YncB( thermonuclease family)